MYTPTTLEEVIGMPQIKEQIRVAVLSALEDNRPVRHILMFGPPGTGKTTLGNIIARMMNANMHYTVANNFSARRALVGLQAKDIIFLDEIHRLKAEEEEKLYLPLSDCAYVDNAGMYAMTMGLYPFTMIGATTRVGDLSQPLIDRFPVHLSLSLYEESELIQIVRQKAERQNIRISDEAIALVASVSRDTPRVAVTMVDRLNDYKDVYKVEEIDVDLVRQVLELMHIQEDGLTDTDVGYLDLLLAADRPMGAKAVAATLSTSPKSIVEFVEPFLLRKGYIAITGRGRILLSKGLRLAMDRRNVGTTDNILWR